MNITEFKAEFLKWVETPQVDCPYCEVLHDFPLDVDMIVCTNCQTEIDAMMAVTACVVNSFYKDT